MKRKQLTQDDPMKAIIEFNLPKDRIAHRCAVNAEEIAFALWNFLYNTKKSIEYEVEEKKLDAYDAIDLVYQKMWDALSEEGINIDKLVE